MKYIYGIDFGTSNSVIQVYDVENGRVLDVPADVETSIESALFFPLGQGGDYLLGAPAVAEYARSGMTGRFLKSIKSALPEPSLAEVTVHTKRVRIETLVSYFIGHLKRQCDAWLGEEVRHVVLGRPTYFSENDTRDALAVQRLTRAARLAGFEEIALQPEPIAAAIEYEQHIDRPETVYVVDIGGGTSDFCIMHLDPARIRDTDRRNDIRSTSGIKIGGDDFDAEIMWARLVPYFGYGAQYESYGKWLPVPPNIFRTICSWEKMSVLKRADIQQALKTYQFFSDNKPAMARLLSLIDNNLAFGVIKAVERAKIALTDDERTRIRFEAHDIAVNEPIAQGEIPGILDGFTASLEKTVRAHLRESAVDPAAIDAVFLTGGSSLVPAVRNTISQVFGADKLQQGHAFRSVAYGLASSARLFFS
ncbi:MAG: Hsp70 family protein [Rhodothermales bacterium]